MTCLSIAVHSSLFSATKVWTRSGKDGPYEIERSRALWGVERFDLLQVHNLLAWRDHLGTLHEMKADGRLGFVGVTTSHGRRHAELERIMLTEPVDFAKRRPLPDWAAEIGCTGWPQVLLTFIVSHPAVTCAIPATSQVAHLRENMGAGVGPLPDAALRRRIAAALGAYG